MFADSLLLKNDQTCVGASEAEPPSFGILGYLCSFLSAEVGWHTKFLELSGAMLIIGKALLRLAIPLIQKQTLERHHHSQSFGFMGRVFVGMNPIVL